MRTKDLGRDAQQQFRSIPVNHVRISGVRVLVAARERRHPTTIQVDVDLGPCDRTEHMLPLRDFLRTRGVGLERIVDVVSVGVPTVAGRARRVEPHMHDDHSVVLRIYGADWATETCTEPPTRGLTGIVLHVVCVGDFASITPAPTNPFTRKTA